MKKTFLLLALICMPLAVFADFQIGAAGYLNIPITPDQVDVNELSVSDFQFGADVRFKLGLFHLQGTAFYRPGDVDLLMYPTIGIFTDIGIAIDIAILRLSLGVGPNFCVVMEEEVQDPVQIGGNVKASAEVSLGKLAVALNWMMIIENLAVEDVADAFENPMGYLGVSVLYKFF